MTNLKLKSEKLFAAVNPDYERVSQWYYKKYQAQESCDEFNKYLYKGHFVVEFNVVPVLYAEPDIDGNYV